jgi:putative sterol carrier protein
MKVLDAKSFFYSIPDKVPAAAIEGVDTLFHFDLEGAKGGQYSVAVKEGKVTISEGLVGEPKCTVKASDENFLALLSGDLNPMMAVLTGKIKISNQGELLKYAKMFGLV